MHESIKNTNSRAMIFVQFGLAIIMSLKLMAAIDCSDDVDGGDGDDDDDDQHRANGVAKLLSAQWC